MVESMKPVWRWVCTCCNCCTCCAMLAVLCHAPTWAGDEALPDPTRPANVSPDVTDGISNDQVLPQLQSVLISPRRRVAVISGQTLHLGEKFGAATVVKITESEVHLKNGTELQKLKLYPDIEKRKSSATRSGKPSTNPSLKD